MRYKQYKVYKSIKDATSEYITDLYSLPDGNAIIIQHNDRGKIYRLIEVYKDASYVVHDYRLDGEHSWHVMALNEAAKTK